ncbi:MAG: SH3 domain-containing protein [Chloroflexi bacterium]|nr:MAG: SH3 domain-containing protein [Chloroflexota bacterium]
MTTTLGILLFLVLVRRRRPDEEEPSLATFVFETLVPVRSPIASLVPAGPGGTAARPGAPPLPPAALEPARKRGARPAVTRAPERRVGRRALERVYVSYRSVRMTASADELSEEVARLQRGDELEVIGSEEGFLNVRTPAGDVGWIRRGTVSGNPPAGTARKQPG